MRTRSILLAATLFFAGDSTLDDNGFKHPYRSWGRETGFYGEPERVTNLAR